MSIEKKVYEIELLFDKLEIELATFTSTTHLFCNAGCGKCCTNPKMEASPLEFLPWAFHLFKIGEAENIHEKLVKHTNPICFNYNQTSEADLYLGSCSTYKYRGLVCRLFGYGATKDKFAQLRLATCSIIKEQQTENYKAANEAINNGLNVPIFTDYYMNLSQIDFRLGNIYVHINKALQMALEEVLQYYAYRIYPE
jgi:Fe-S-cluster containining protein